MMKTFCHCADAPPASQLAMNMHAITCFRAGLVTHFAPTLRCATHFADLRAIAADADAPKHLRYVTGDAATLRAR
jgi:hypothetical protein